MYRVLFSTIFSSHFYLIEADVVHLNDWKWVAYIWALKSHYTWANFDCMETVSTIKQIWKPNKLEHSLIHSSIQQVS